MDRQLRNAPVWMLVLLAPVMAFAQSGSYTGSAPLNAQVYHSPLAWAWVVILALSVAAFVGYSLRISRHRRPPTRPIF